MALRQCPECRKWISDHAITCPNCGFPFPEKTSLKEDNQKETLNSMKCPKCGSTIVINRNQKRNIIIGGLTLIGFAMTIPYISIIDSGVEIKQSVLALGIIMIFTSLFVPGKQKQCCVCKYSWK